MIGTRGKNGGDDNNADDENEPNEIRGKKKKAKRGAPVGLRRWFAIQKETQLLRWHDKGRKELNKYGKFRHPADAAQWGNINTHGLTTQGAYGLL
jgi:hypothetical protein